MDNVRVVRGPDWKSGNQDGGEGLVGTVVEVKAGGATVVVQWDNGNRHEYSCGSGGNFELRVFDNAPAGIKHRNVMCDSCRQHPITGTRWKCSKCPDYDLCSQCYNAGRHNVEHTFSRIDHEDGSRTQVAPRKSARKVVAKGLFQDATVMRGRDWKWDNQDGGPGKTGILQKFQGWADEQDNTRNAARVEWSASHRGNVYRVGHKGMVDLKCVQPASGGNYYPEHLQVLSKASPAIIKSGDYVQVQVELAEFQRMQEGHGGWAGQLSETVGKVGRVKVVFQDADVKVEVGGQSWTYNPYCLKPAPGERLSETYHQAISSLSCDVYFYGMVLYEIFARKPPFDDIKTDYFL